MLLRRTRAVSMINAKIFDVVNQVGKAIRKNSNPFGGLQVRIKYVVLLCVKHS